MEVGLAIVFVVLLAVCVALSYCWQAEYEKTQKLTRAIDDSLREITADAITDSLRKTLPMLVLALQERLTDAVARIGKQDSKIVSLESQRNEQVGIIQKLERLNADKTIYGDRLHAQTVELRNELAEAKIKANRFEQSCKSYDISLASYKENLASVAKELDATKKELETLRLQNSGLLEAIEDRDELNTEQVKSLLREVDRLKSEIRSNLDAKRPKPWKRFLSNLVKESNQS